MAYDEGLAQRIRETLGDISGLEEKKMFGGIGFLLHGNMVCGVHQEALIVRVGPEGYAEALAGPHVREFDITGRPMKGWVLVDQGGVEEDESLRDWVQKGLEFSQSLPPK